MTPSTRSTFRLATDSTPDSQLNAISVQEKRILVSKDSDFVDSLLLRGVPYKLLLIATGNVRNAELEALLLANLSLISDAFEASTFIEIDRDTLRVHR